MVLLFLIRAWFQSKMKKATRFILVAFFIPETRAEIGRHGRSWTNDAQLFGRFDHTAGNACAGCTGRLRGHIICRGMQNHASA